VIGIIHAMECSKFPECSQHLHNGDPLYRRTRLVPAGRPAKGTAPFSFEESAIDASSTNLAGATTVGATLGAQTVTLDLTMIPSHNHGGITGDDSPDHTHTFAALQTPGASYSIAGTSATTAAAPTRNTSGASTRHQHSIASAGGGAAHANVQPTAIVYCLIKT
jgi:microcystin-dependent protein